MTELGAPRAEELAALDRARAALPAVRRRRRGSRKALVLRVLVAADLLGLSIAFAIAMLAFGSHTSATDGFSGISEIGLFVATLPGWLLLAKLHGLYDRDEQRAVHSTADDLVAIVKLVTFGSWLLFLGGWLISVAAPYPPKLFTFWVAAICVVTGFRLAARAFARRRPAYVQNAVVVGGGVVGRLLVQKLVSRPEFGIDVLGYVDTDRADDADAAELAPFLGGVENLPALVSGLDVERVLIAFPSAPHAEITDLVRDLRRLDVHVDVVPRLYEVVAPSADIHTVEGLPLLGLPPARLVRTAWIVKRAIDITGAALALLLLAPVFAWIALRIRLDSPGPVFYRHERVGLGGRSFRLVKFRTMYSDYGGATPADVFEQLLEDPTLREEFARTQKLVDDPRVTRFGRLLRRLSLDELPQLVNVLRGDMSLVGPRPVTLAELDRYGDEAGTLVSFRPGATGYWQVNGRSQTEYEDRVRLDLAYIHGWSLKLDFLILAKTFWVMLTGHGAY